ncbi:MAG TPA: hypothetical protein VFJ43_05190 [Bacteroidia bacterium]|nr:hypothetical protein [Bacteroidia bacterium]
MKFFIMIIADQVYDDLQVIYFLIGLVLFLLGIVLWRKKYSTE